MSSTGTTVCAGNSTTLQVANPQPGYIYNWFDKSTGGNLVNTGDSFTTGALTHDTTFYVASALATGCSSSTRTSVTVTVNAAPPVPTVVNASVPVCNNQSATLQVANPVPSYTYTWYTSAVGGTPVATGPTYVVNNVTANKTYYVQATNPTGCPGNQRAPVNVTVLLAPAPATVAVNVPAVCPGSTVTLTASAADANATFRWFDQPNSTTAIYAGNPFTSGPINTDTTFYVEVTNVSGCVSNSRTAATVPVYELVAPEVTVASITPTSITFQWPSVPGATGYKISLDSGNTFITPSSGPMGLTHTVTGLLPGETVSIIMEIISNISCVNGMKTDATTATTTNPLTDIFVPNVFTPNGDGKNDVFKVFGNAISQVEMYIYNQWGEKIYQEIGADPKWDGTAGGTQQPVGVYVYFVKVTMRNGQVIIKKNALNLIR